jgi:hypothetical protein
MNNYMHFPEFQARWIYLLRRNSYSLSSRFFSEFYRSTLPLIDKLNLLKTMPLNEQEILDMIDILKSYSDSKLYDNRDNEWARFVSNLPINKESIYVSMKETLKMSA